MNLFKILRRGDFVLLFLFLACAALVAASPLIHSPSEARRVRITCRGEEFGIYPLDKDAEITVTQAGNTNIIAIENHTVHMESATCHNQVCVDTGVISRTGETIVCLPNRVVVEILGPQKGGEDDEGIDAVVK